MKLLSLISATCSIFFLHGCLSAAIISSAAIATKSVTDPRSLGRQVDDGILKARVSLAINKEQDITRNARIITTAYKGKILLTGQSPDIKLSEKAKKIATKIKGVEAVYNEIRQSIPINLNRAAKDAWITTQIKSKILANNLAKSSALKVLTEDGEVFLLGIIRHQEGKKVAKIASEIKGVKRVTTAFTYTN